MSTDREKQVILFPIGTLQAIDIARLDEAGYLALEVADPNAVVMLTASTPLIGADDMLMSALWGLASDGAGVERTRFIGELYKRLKAREAARAAASPGEKP